MTDGSAPSVSRRTEDHSPGRRETPAVGYLHVRSTGSRVDRLAPSPPRVPLSQTVSQLEYNAFTRALDSAAGVLQRFDPSLGRIEAGSILDTARRQTGLTDFGDEDFLEPLHRIIEEVPLDRFTSLARVVMRSIFVEAAKNRLRIQDYLKKHPEVLDLPVERPVFVLGFPRSGTTVLQNLLSRDSNRRSLRFWELTHPVPVHDDPAVDARRRIRTARRILRLAYLVAPEMGVVHEVRATTAEECWPLFENNFTVLNFDLQSGARGYGDWLEARDMRPAYRFYRQQLQILQHRQPGRQLVLKCPEHLWFLDTLLEVFPDAHVVWTHRDPYDSVASYCSLISLTWRMLYGRIQPEAIGEHIAYRFASGVDAAMRARDRMGADDRIHDVDFRHLVTDPAGVLQDLTDRFDLQWSEPIDEVVRSVLRDRRKDKRGAHKYDGAFYGLDPDALYARFADYIERFELPTAAAAPLRRAAGE